MSRIIKNKFKICDMHCTSCAINIDFDLEDLDGVRCSNTSYASCVCEVEYDEEKLNHDEIIKQIKKTGYDAKLI